MEERGVHQERVDRLQQAREQELAVAAVDDPTCLHAHAEDVTGLVGAEVATPEPSLPDLDASVVDQEHAVLDVGITLALVGATSQPNMRPRLFSVATKDAKPLPETIVCLETAPLFPHWSGAFLARLFALTDTPAAFIQVTRLPTSARVKA